MQLIDSPTTLPPALADDDDVDRALAAGAVVCTACAGAGHIGRARTSDCWTCAGTGWEVRP